MRGQKTAQWHKCQARLLLYTFGNPFADNAYVENSLPMYSL
ncbi:hypothetical protein [Pokkaliibacter plantistimulans]|nr:hypothetical protein [Pokkaliibacter plantistimulans]